MMFEVPRVSKDLPGGSDGKASVYSVRDPGSIPGLGRFPGEGNGNPLQYSCLGNPMKRGAWWATTHRVERVGQGLMIKPPPPSIFTLRN